MSQGPHEHQGPDTPDPSDALIDPDQIDPEDSPETFDPINPGDPTSEINPYDTSWVPPDRPPGHSDWGTTLTEMREGEPLDLRLSEEEPDVLDRIDPATLLPDEEAALDAQLATEVDAEDPEVLAALAAEGGDTDFPAPSYAEPDPRSGRLVEEDEGAHPDLETDLVARDLGISGAAASAEEAAVHIIDEP